MQRMMAATQYSVFTPVLDLTCQSPPVDSNRHSSSLNSLMIELSASAAGLLLPSKPVSDASRWVYCISFRLRHHYAQCRAGWDENCYSRSRPTQPTWWFIHSSMFTVMLQAGYQDIGHENREFDITVRCEIIFRHGKYDCCIISSSLRC